MSSETTRMEPRENADVASRVQFPPAQVDKPAAPETPAVPQGPSFVLMAFYNYVRRDGGMGPSRAFIEGLPDLRTREQIVRVEQLILQDQNDKGAELVSVQLTDWRTLEG